MKRSNLIPLLSVLLLTGMFLVSCNKSVEYANVIPADASAVISLDLNSLSQKSGLKDNEALKQKLTDVLQSGLDANALQYMEKVIEKPSESGISLSDKVYLFATDAAQSLGLVAKVSDKSKLEALFKLLEDEQIAVKPVDTGVDDYQYTILNEKDIACFNGTTLLILTGKSAYDMENAKQEALRLLALPAGQNIVSNKGFKQMNSKKGDIGAYMTMDALPTRYAMLYTNNLPENISLKDIAFTGTLNFEKGKVALEMETVQNDTLSKYQQQYKEVISRLGTEFLGYFPASSLMYTGANINGEKLVDFLSAKDEYRQLLKDVDGSGVDLGKLIGSIDGNVSYAITSLSPQGMPSLICYAKVKNDEIIKAVNNSLGQSVKKTGENNYSVILGMGMSGYYGMQGNVLYFTTDESVVNNIFKQTTNPMSDAKWVASLKNSYGFMVVNVKDALSLPIVNLGMSTGGQQAALLRTILALFDYIEFAVPEMNKMEMNVIMANQKENALKQLIMLGEELARN